MAAPEDQTLSNRPTRSDLLPHLRRPLALTRAGMVAEALVRAFWPFWTVLILVLVPFLAGWHLLELAPVLLWGLAGAAVLALVATLIWGAMRLRWPSRAAALARLDQQMPGRPIAALRDQQAIGTGDAASEAVWKAHQRRMETASRAAKAPAPNLQLARQDRYGLRYIAFLFFAVALFFGGLFGAGGTAPSAGAAAQVAGPVWEGWIEPPAYTGKPPLYLADLPAGALRVPQGSHLTVRLYGETGALSVVETVSGQPAGTTEEQAALVQEFDIVQDGTLEIVGPGGTAWTVRLALDQAPEVEQAGPLDVRASGEMALPFAAHDDYGVVRGRAIFSLDISQIDQRFGLAATPDLREDLVVDLPMPFSGSRDDFDEKLIDDFSQHAFANLPVTLVLEVSDAAGQTGQSVAVEMILPGRRFFQPIARAVVEQRRDLLWAQANAPRVLGILRAISYAPEGLFPNEITYLRLRFTIRQLAAKIDDGLTSNDQDEIALALWDLAVQLEDGTLADARARIARAQERLAEAMRNGASNEEIAALMDELRAATDDYLDMLAQNAAPGDENQADQPDTAEQEMMNITQDEIQALMDRIQELMEEGRMAEAQELMEQLNQLMENLQVTQNSGPGGDSPGQQSMQDLSETLRDQQELSDEAFRDLQEEFNGERGQDGGQDQGQQQPGGSGQPGQQGNQGQGQSPGDNPQNGRQSDLDGGGEGQQSTEGQGDTAAQTLAEQRFC